MVQETVQAIKDAEREAEKRIHAAQEECGRIEAEAKEEARQLKEKALEEAREEAARKLSKTKEEGQRILEEAAEEAEKEAEALRKLAAGKEARAVEKIISSLL